MKQADEILAFWLDELGSDGWYRADKAVDDDIRDRFEFTWERSQVGACGLWLTDPAGALAYIIMTDQFSRNMYRDDARAFASDKAARAAAKVAIDREWDRAISEPARMFFYMPLMHSENLIDQDRAVRLIHSRLPDTGSGTLEHARVHRAIIRKFGRFPYRNAALGRAMTPAEQTFLDDGGYGAAFRAHMAAMA
ncbi:MAG: hypothetical protein ACI82I_000514 [Gammaproteobacteria bacterium]